MHLHPDPQFDRLLLRSFTGTHSADRTAIEGATHIASGDLVGWERYWRMEGEHALDQADARLASDDVSGAGKYLLAAGSAFGLAAILYGSDPESVAWQTNRAAQVSSFRAAIPLLPDECDVVEVDGMHGYLFYGAVRDAPCVLVPCGVDAFAEDGYARRAQAAVDAGLTCLIVELGLADESTALNTVIAWAHRNGLNRVALAWCLDDPPTVTAVEDLVHDPPCPIIVLPRGSPYGAAFAWMSGAR